MVQPLRTPDPALDAGRDAAIFFTWMALALLLLPASLIAARTHSELAGFLLVPILSVALFYENLTIAVNALTDGGLVPTGMERLRGAVQSFVIPLFLVAEFELNYEVHKRRSANFFGCIKFDQGHRTSTGEAAAAMASVGRALPPTRAPAPPARALQACSASSCATPCGCWRSSSCSSRSW